MHAASPQPEETRSRLLEAASAIFADKGYHRATVREICALAKVNLALVNYHFGDKLELYTAVLRHSLKDAERMQQVHTLLSQQEAPEVLLRKMIRLTLRLMMKRREQGNVHMRLMLHELAQPTAAMGKVVDESIKPIHDRLRLLLSRILGLPPEHDKTRMCAQSIIGQIIHYAHHLPVISRLWPELSMTPAQQEIVADHIADFSLAYLQSFGKIHSGKPARHPDKETRKND